MKTFVLTILGIATWGFIQAQDCMPDQEVPDSVVVAPLPYNAESRPDGGLQDTACVDTYFETVFTFNIPSVFEYLGNPVPIAAVAIPVQEGIGNLPASMSYVCNPPNCVFEAEASGCLVIYGTPATDEIGVYDLGIEVEIQTGVINFDLTLPQGLEDDAQYLLTVAEAGFDNCAVVSSYETFEAQFSLQNQPNPFGDFTQVVVSSQTQGNFQFVVTDLLGKVVHRQPVEIFEGENQIEFHGNHLPEGLYIYAITDGIQAVSSKMVINR